MISGPPPAPICSGGAEPRLELGLVTRVSEGPHPVGQGTSSGAMVLELGFTGWRRRKLRRPKKKGHGRMGGETNSKVVQAFQTFSKRYNTAQTFSSLFKPVRNVTKLLKPSQTFSNLLKPLQTSPSLINNFSKDAQNFSNLLKLSQNFSQKQNKNKKKHRRRSLLGAPPVWAWPKPKAQAYLEPGPWHPPFWCTWCTDGRARMVEKGASGTLCPAHATCAPQPGTCSPLFSPGVCSIFIATLPLC